FASSLARWLVAPNQAEQLHHFYNLVPSDWQGVSLFATGQNYLFLLEKPCKFHSGQYGFFFSEKSVILPTKSFYFWLACRIYL
ncbi:MAG TPA: hypothetical protein PK299_14865, partial [Anaerolineales bacterium]|nr:hypothetical protein [Anaerolineales bacterium]